MSNKNTTKIPCGGFSINPTLALDNGVLGVNAKVLRVVMEQNPDARGDEPSERYYIADDSDYKTLKELYYDVIMPDELHGGEYSIWVCLYGVERKMKRLVNTWNTINGLSNSYGVTTITLHQTNFAIANEVPQIICIETKIQEVDGYEDITFKEESYIGQLAEIN